MRSVWVFVSLEDCTASSRMRCKMDCVSFSAPSAVCTSEMPSCALRTAWFRPLTCAPNFCAIAKPAASSAALLMRKPDDNRRMVVDMLVEVVIKLRWVSIALMLVLMRNPIVGVASSAGLLRRPHGRGADPPALVVPICLALPRVRPERDARWYEFARAFLTTALQHVRYRQQEISSTRQPL